MQVSYPSCIKNKGVAIFRIMERVVKILLERGSQKGRGKGHVEKGGARNLYWQNVTELDL